MEGRESSDENDGQVPDTISYHIPSRPNTPSTPLHDHELRTHRSIYWNGLTGM